MSQVPCYSLHRMQRQSRLWTLLLCAVLCVAQAQWIYHSGMMVAHQTSQDSDSQTQITLCNTLGQNSTAPAAYVAELQALGVLPPDTTQQTASNCSLCELSHIDITLPTAPLLTLHAPLATAFTLYSHGLISAHERLSTIRAPPTLS